MGTVICILSLMAVVVLAIYHTLFKTRRELNESQEKLKSELFEVRKLLERITDKA